MLLKFNIHFDDAIAAARLDKFRALNAFNWLYDLKDEKYSTSQLLFIELFSKTFYKSQELTSTPKNSPPSMPTRMSTKQRNVRLVMIHNNSLLAPC